MAHKKQQTESSRPAKNYLDLFYMTPSEVKAGDLAELLKDETDLGIELWEEMNVLELELHNHNTVDFEPLDNYFRDPSDAAFIKNRNIKTIFAVNLAEEDLTAVKAFFEIIIDKYSGFLCTDSMDFNPVYVGSTVKP